MTQTPEPLVAQPKGDWIWNSQTSVPPGNGQLRTNTGKWADATTISATAIDNNGVDRSGEIEDTRVGEIIRMQHYNDNSRWATFTAQAIAVKQSGYYTITVTPLAEGGTIPNSGTAIAVTSDIPYVPPDPAPTPNPGYMSMMIQLQPNITTDIVGNLQDYLCEYLRTVTHLVNYVSLSANVGGVIIKEAEPILPASKGDLVPPPV